MASVATSALAGPRSTRKSYEPPPLQPGDIVYADSGDPINGGFIIKVDPSSGESVVLSAGGYLRMPYDLIIDHNGLIVVSDWGRLIRIDPRTGTQTIIADNAHGPLGSPFGLALTPGGDILAANLVGIVRFDLRTRQLQAYPTGDRLGYPLAVEASNHSYMFVLSLGPINRIIRVSYRTGAQQFVTQGGLLNHPQALTVRGNSIYVTDLADSDDNFGIGCVIRVNAQTGAQTLVSAGGYLVAPVGITVDERGQLIVGDPYTINPNSPDILDGGFDGGIIRIDPATGRQTLVARGEGSFRNPRGVAVVPSSLPPRSLW